MFIQLNISLQCKILKLKKWIKIVDITFISIPSFSKTGYNHSLNSTHALCKRIRHPPSDKNNFSCTHDCPQYSHKRRLPTDCHVKLKLVVQSALNNSINVAL